MHVRPWRKQHHSGGEDSDFECGVVHVMVIELLGSSGAGKTTLADALVRRLTLEGYTVRAVIGRRTGLLSRSLARSIGAIQTWSPGAPQARLASVLMGLLPPRSFLWSMRLRGYISYLCDMSISNPSGADITLLDQGFVQLVCSFVVLSGIVDTLRITEALACIPKPDLLIRVDASFEVLGTRLSKRRQHLGPIQRQLELDLQTSLKQVNIVKMLSEMLASEEPGLVTISCSDERSMAGSIEKIISEVRSRTDKPPALHCASRRQYPISAPGENVVRSLRAHVARDGDK
jgi:thymidylate kinase